jgi:hypothetical protein
VATDDAKVRRKIVALSAATERLRAAGSGEREAAAAEVKDRFDALGAALATYPGGAPDDVADLADAVGRSSVSALVVAALEGFSERYPRGAEVAADEDFRRDLDALIDFLQDAKVLVGAPHVTATLDQLQAMARDANRGRPRRGVGDQN